MIRRLLRWAADTAKWVLRRPERIVAIALCGGLGAAAGVVPGTWAYDYTWKDPRFCDDCHVHDYANEAYERSIHAGLTTCHDCHRVPIRHYPKNLWLAAFDRPGGPDDIHAPDVASVVCEQCHAEHDEEEPLTGPMSEEVRRQVVKIDDSPMHQLHLKSRTRDPGPYRGATHRDGPAVDHGVGDAHDAEGVITCMDCHGSETNRAHRFEAQQANCLECHGELEEEAGGRMARVSCQACHFPGFLGSI